MGNSVSASEGVKLSSGKPSRFRRKLSSLEARITLDPGVEVVQSSYKKCISMYELQRERTPSGVELTTGLPPAFTENAVCAAPTTTTPNRKDSGQNGGGSSGRESGSTGRSSTATTSPTSPVAQQFLAAHVMHLLNVDTTTNTPANGVTPSPASFASSSATLDHLGGGSPASPLPIGDVAPTTMSPSRSNAIVAAEANRRRNFSGRSPLRRMDRTESGGVGERDEPNRSSGESGGKRGKNAANEGGAHAEDERRPSTSEKLKQRITWIKNIKSCISISGSNGGGWGGGGASPAFAATLISSPIRRLPSNANGANNAAKSSPMPTIRMRRSRENGTNGGGGGALAVATRNGETTGGSTSRRLSRQLANTPNNNSTPAPFAANTNGSIRKLGHRPLSSYSTISGITTTSSYTAPSASSGANAPRRQSLALTSGASAFSTLSRQNRTAARRSANAGLALSPTFDMGPGGAGGIGGSGAGALDNRSSGQSGVGSPAQRRQSMHPISAAGRDIIKFCFDSPHAEIGTRIYTRLYDRRIDFRNFAHSLGRDRWALMCFRLKDFLDEVVLRVDRLNMVEALAKRFGEEHVSLKANGFKPDFWVTLADAITVECVILDQAAHQPSETITAWSLFISILFSAMRDGYYQALRAQRISLRHKNQKAREEEAELLASAQDEGPIKAKSDTRVQFLLHVDQKSGTSSSQQSSLSPSAEARHAQPPHSQPSQQSQQNRTSAAPPNAAEYSSLLVSPRPSGKFSVGASIDDERRAAADRATIRRGSLTKSGAVSGGDETSLALVEHDEVAMMKQSCLTSPTRPLVGLAGMSLPGTPRRGGGGGGGPVPIRFYGGTSIPEH